MARKGHYLKRPGRATAPAAIVSVVATTDADPTGAAGGSCELLSLRQILVCTSRFVRGAWTGRDEHVFTTADSFWSWFEGWCQTGRRTYVVCPTASDVLTLTGFWGMITARGARWVRGAAGGGSGGGDRAGYGGYTVRRRVLNGSPDIFDYSYNGKSVVWLSARNFYAGEPSELLSGPGLAGRVPAGDTDGPAGVPVSSARRRCRDTLSMFQRLSDWWVKLDAGSFALTVGAMGERFLRSRMTGPPPCTHGHDDARRLERLAAHRGRTQTWYYGCVKSPDATDADSGGVPEGAYGVIPSEAVHIDVRSMYPYLLATTDMPTKLLSYRERCSVDELRSYCDTNVCTARVLIESDKAEFPHRTKAGVVYPVGRFASYLSGLELKRALDDGDVAAVYEAAVYARGRPFAAAADELLRLRTDARAAGDDGWELFIKLLSNSLTGKLAQNLTKWVERPMHPPVKAWGEWPEVNPSDGLVRRYRATAGLVEERVRSEGGRGTLTACYGHLTAACSHYTRGIRERMPARCVLSLDTDGMWILPAGLESLAADGVEFSDEPGRLRVTTVSRWSRWWGPKHYFAAGRWTLSGLSGPVRRGTGLTFGDITHCNPVRTSRCIPEPHTVRTTRTVSLTLIPTGGIVGPDGWVIPSRLPAAGPAAVTVDHHKDARNDRQNETSKSLFD